MMFAWKTLLATLAATSTVAFTAITPPNPELVWNASASVPVGLYRVQPLGQLRVTDLVVVRPPEELAWFLAEGRYVPRGVPLLKRIAALPGQRVCRSGTTIAVDDVPFGEALERDRRGRSLPVWQGCSVLGPGQVFLLNPDRPDSLDGRYFGPLPLGSVIGRARPLWTEEEQ